MKRIVRDASILTAFLLCLSGCTSSFGPLNSQVIEALIREKKSDLQDSYEDPDVVDADYEYELSEVHEQDQSEETEVSIEKSPVIEIGKLDRAPMRFEDKGWVVQQDDRFGYLNKEGEWVIHPVYDSIQFVPEADGDGLTVCVLYDEAKGSPFPGNGALLPHPYFPAGAAYGLGGTGAPDYYVLNDQNQVVHTAEPGTPISPNASRPEDPCTIFKDTVKRDQRPYSEYWIWDPSDDSIYGPYAPEDKASFLLEAVVHESDTPGMSTLNDLRNARCGSLFWTTENGKRTLVSASAGDTISGFDYTDNIDSGVIGGLRNGNYEVYDSDLNLLYSTTFDGGASPIGETVPLKDGDTWVLGTLRQAKDGPASISTRNPAADAPFDQSSHLQDDRAGVYLLNFDMNVRTSPDYSASKQYLISAHVYISVSETRDGSNGSIWGQIDPDHWICLSDADEVYCNSITDPTVFNEEMMNSIVYEHYRALPSTSSGVARYTTDWTVKGDVATGSLVCSGGTLSITVLMNSGLVEDNMKWDSRYFK